MEWAAARLTGAPGRVRLAVLPHKRTGPATGESMNRDSKVSIGLGAFGSLASTVAATVSAFRGDVGLAALLASLGLVYASRTLFLYRRAKRRVGPE